MYSRAAQFLINSWTIDQWRSERQVRGLLCLLMSSFLNTWKEHELPQKNTRVERGGTPVNTKLWPSKWMPPALLHPLPVHADSRIHSLGCFKLAHQCINRHTYTPSIRLHVCIVMFLFLLCCHCLVITVWGCHYTKMLTLRQNLNILLNTLLCFKIVLLN